MGFSKITAEMIIRSLSPEKALYKFSQNKNIEELLNLLYLKRKWKKSY